MNKNIAKRLKMNKAIQNIDDVKKAIDTYYRLRYEVAKLLDANNYDGTIETIDIDYRNDNLAIVLTTDSDCWGEHFTKNYCFNIPIEWLFLDAEELEKAKREKEKKQNS